MLCSRTLPGRTALEGSVCPTPQGKLPEGNRQSLSDVKQTRQKGLCSETEHTDIHTFNGQPPHDLLNLLPHSPTYYTP